mgnify:CR=1 FL=1
MKYQATILSKAIEYIAQLEKSTDNLAQGNAALQAKVTAFEGFIRTRQKKSISLF